MKNLIKFRIKTENQIFNSIDYQLHIYFSYIALLIFFQKIL